MRKNRSPDHPHPKLQPSAWNLNGICTVAGIPRTGQVTPLPELLRKAGYRTIHVGKAHFGAVGTPGEDPRHFGFDVNTAGHAAGGPGSYWGVKNFSAAWRTRPPEHIWDVPGLEAYHGQNIYLTEALTREATKEVERSVADQQPSYLYLSHYAVHAPWEQDDRYYQKYLDAGLKPFEAPLASMIEGMDQSLGDMRAALEETGEPALLREMLGSIQPGDVLLADHCYCGRFLIALLQQSGVDVVVRLQQLREADFRKGRRLGPGDHLVHWPRPARPEWMNEETYARMPASLKVREVAVQVAKKGFRVESLVVVTTLRDGKAYPAEELAKLYRRR